eukprot:UN1432
MLKAFKPSVAYEPTDLVPTPNKSRQEVDAIKEANGESWKASFVKAYAAFEAEVDSKVKETFADAGAQVDMSVNMSTFDKYFLKKVLPVLAVEVFPHMMQPIGKIVELAETPAKELADMDIFVFISKVAPIVTSISKVVSAETSKYLPNATEELPVRKCQTCAEHLQLRLADLSTGGCGDSCIGVFNTCGASVDKDCVVTTNSCLECVSSTLADYDHCTGFANNTKTIARINNITKSLSTATTPEGFDSFLDRLSVLIVRDE